ncbi:Mor transcription activator family protein [compost metagenome]
MSDVQALPIHLLPPLLQEFVRLIGLAPTMALVQVMGGRRVYIPKSATSEHPFAAIIGLENLLKLGTIYGGEDHFQLPKAERAILALRNASIAESYAASKTARSLAIEYGLTEGQIVRIVSALGVAAPADRRQKALF